MTAPTEHLFCSRGCGRFVFARHDDTPDTIRRRAVDDRGWVVFEHSQVCNCCRRNIDALHREAH